MLRAMSAASDAAGLFYEDARRTVEAQVAALRESDKNALDVVRTTGVVIGLALSALAFADRAVGGDRLPILAFAALGAGFALLFLGAILGVAAAFKGPVRTGIAPDVIDAEIRSGAERERAIVGLALAYARSTRENGHALAVTASRLRRAYAAFAAGLILVGLGSAGFWISIPWVNR